MKFMFAILALAGINVSAEAQGVAQQKMDIVSIADQFIVSSVAAKKCSQIDSETEKAFQSNFLAVSIRKAQMLKERYPQMSEEQIAEQDKNATEMLKVKADQVITEYGCQSPAVQQLIQRYKMQAAWKIGG